VRLEGWGGVLGAAQYPAVGSPGNVSAPSSAPGDLVQPLRPPSAGPEYYLLPCPGIQGRSLGVAGLCADEDPRGVREPLEKNGVPKREDKQGPPVKSQ
jgi:hypothetical protein